MAEALPEDPITRVIDVSAFGRYARRFYCKHRRVGRDSSLAVSGMWFRTYRSRRPRMLLKFPTTKTHSTFPAPAAQLIAAEMSQAHEQRTPFLS